MHINEVLSNDVTDHITHHAFWKDNGQWSLDLFAGQPAERFATMPITDEEHDWLKQVNPFTIKHFVANNMDRVKAV